MMNFKLILEFLGIMQVALKLVNKSRTGLGDDKEPHPKKKVGELSRSEIIHEANLADYLSLQIEALLFLEKVDRYYTTAPKKLPSLIERSKVKLVERRKKIQELEERQFFPLERPDMVVDGDRVVPL